MTGERRLGRPRSQATRAAILAAALAELDERGYAALTVDGIARRAGCGKQTIYRWWSSKADVVLESLLERAETAIRIPDEGSLPDDLMAFLKATFAQRGQRPTLIGLLAHALLDPAFAAEFKNKFLFKRRDALRVLFDRAVARGEIAADADVELLIDIVYGVLWYRFILEHAPVDDELGERLTTLLIKVTADPHDGSQSGHDTAIARSQQRKQHGDRDEVRQRVDEDDHPDVAVTRPQIAEHQAEHALEGHDRAQTGEQGARAQAG
jgi:AcrR family transcriptional regulator